jgi:hypothetical protein
MVKNTLNIPIAVLSSRAYLKDIDKAIEKFEIIGCV